MLVGRRAARRTTARGRPRRPPAARAGAAQILAARPGLVVVPIRGNVGTRLEKLARGDAEALCSPRRACGGWAWRRRAPSPLSVELSRPPRAGPARGGGPRRRRRGRRRRGGARRPPRPRLPARRARVPRRPRRRVPRPGRRPLRAGGRRSCAWRRFVGSADGRAPGGERSVGPARLDPRGPRGARRRASSPACAGERVVHLVGAGPGDPGLLTGRGPRGARAGRCRGARPAVGDRALLGARAAPARELHRRRQGARAAPR